MMEAGQSDKKSQLLLSLREAVGLVQMLLFKAIRIHLEKQQTGVEKTEISMLAGSITNEVFGTPNPEPRFTAFRENNWGTIEQELLGLKDSLGFLCRHLTDALRIQTLCDSQEGEDSSATLLKAAEYGYLMEEREIPLPSTFMTIIRELGKDHGLIIPPVQISPEDDNALVH
jgi:hypothetical protein